MTKAQETALLARTIETFGPSSYLGPWLAEYRAELETTIAQDLPPAAMLPAAAYAEARAILETARQDAERIRTEARTAAAAELERARVEARRLIDETFATIGRAQSTLERLLDHM
jgi:F0F1-type ATP synthase membrane subunit b/b'